MMFKDALGSRLSVGYKAPQYVYGEMEKIEDYYILLSNSKNLNRNSVFCDLGSGLGKANLLVGLMFPISQSIGVEYVPKLHQVALAQKFLFEKILVPKLENSPKITFICNDMLQCAEEWLHSDVIYMNCVTWKESIIKKLVKLLERLKVGTEIFSTNLLISQKLELRGEFQSRAIWGTQMNYLYLVN